MRREAESEVLVVGAGPVGMVTALVLAQAGVEVQIIDKDIGDAARSYACVLHARTLRILETLGLAEELSRLGRTVERIGCFNGATRWAELDLEKAGGAVTVLPQSDLEELLERRLAKLGVSVNWGHRLSGMTASKEDVWTSIDELTTTGKGYAVPHLDQVVRRTTRARREFLVGADGRDSNVREFLGIDQKTFGPATYYHIYEIKPGGALPDEIRLIFGPASVNSFTPLPENRCRWIFQVPPEDLPDEVFLKERTHFRIIDPRHVDVDLFEKLVAERAPWFDAGVEEIEWHGTISFESRIARSFGRDRCWLAGDAAHLAGPIGMHSMNLGILEGAELGRALARILRENGSVELLERYGANFRAAWEQLLEPQQDLARTGSPAPVSPPLERLISCLPAAGGYLGRLLLQLGITLKAGAREDLTLGAAAAA